MKKYKIALGISLILNALLLGVLLGPVAHSPMMRHMPFGGMGDHGPMKILGMSADGQAILDSKMKADMAEHQDDMKAISALRQDLVKIISADKFDLKAFRAKRAEIEKSHDQMAQHFGSVLEDILPKLSLEDRRAFGNNLVHMPSQGHWMSGPGQDELRKGPAAPRDESLEGK